jgi:hypothetical protein
VIADDEGEDVEGDAGQFRVRGIWPRMRKPTSTAEAGHVCRSDGAMRSTSGNTAVTSSTG